MRENIKKLFENDVIVAIGSIWAWLMTFLFPTATIKTAAGAVMIIMCLDLVTKFFAIAKQSGGIIAAFRKRCITSKKFAKGTLDKLIIFGVMLIISGCAYNLLVVEELAVWFSQMVFTLMFLRDVISIIENLNDAGIQGLGLFKKMVKKKLDDYYEEEKKDEPAQITADKK